jgi:ElaB/YqjD/DUF883 family membrane-anchored ribosome-binding protein
MSFITAILECLTGTHASAQRHTYRPIALSAEIKQPTPYQPSSPPEDEADMAQEFIEALRSAEASGEALKIQLQSVVRTHGWSENLAQRILNGVVRIVEQSREKIGPVMRDALEKAEGAANDLFTFAREHPYQAAGYATIIAVGILIPYAPWVLEALGFGELGPVLGRYTAISRHQILVGRHFGCLHGAFVTNPALGSFAAWWESTYAGYIPAGSLFSFLQRLGMTWARAAQATKTAGLVVAKL